MTVPSWARVGAKVVCIKRDEWKLRSGSDRGIAKPTYGAICVVVGVDSWYGNVLLQLAGYGEHLFFASNFRPLVSRTQEQDVTAIRKLVDDMPQEIRVDLIGELL